MTEGKPVARGRYARNNTGMKEKSDPAERVRASEARKIQEGGRRMPGGVMPPDAVAALDKLIAAGYGNSTSGCIFRAIIEAAASIGDGKSRGKAR